MTIDVIYKYQILVITYFSPNYVMTFKMPAYSFVDILQTFLDPPCTPPGYMMSQNWPLILQSASLSTSKLGTGLLSPLMS